MSDREFLAELIQRHSKAKRVNLLAMKVWIDWAGKLSSIDWSDVA